MDIDTPLGIGERLFLAARSGDAAEVASLMARGADPLADALGRRGNFNGSTFVAAIKLDHSACVDLMARSCGVAGPGPGLSSPLHWAAEHGAIDSLRVLLALGADPQALDSKNQTPFMAALTFGAETFGLRPDLPDPDASNWARCLRALLPTADFSLECVGVAKSFTVSELCHSFGGPLADAVRQETARRAAAIDVAALSLAIPEPAPASRPASKPRI